MSGMTHLYAGDATTRQLCRLMKALGLNNLNDTVEQIVRERVEALDRESVETPREEREAVEV